MTAPPRAPLVRFEHKAARKALGTKQRRARALRFKGEKTDLDAPASGVSLAVLLKATRRDLLGALLLAAYDTGCRRSELAAMWLEDIEGHDSDGAGLVEIGRSKTDQEGQGAITQSIFSTGAPWIASRRKVSQAATSSYLACHAPAPR